MPPFQGGGINHYPTPPLCAGLRLVANRFTLGQVGNNLNALDHYATFPKHVSAEGGRFELPVQFPVRHLSKVVH